MIYIIPAKRFPVGMQGAAVPGDVGQAFSIWHHLYMEHKDDDDDDVSFAKWMSSFWGHSWREEDQRGLRERHRPQATSHRKTSLPCPLPVLSRIPSSDCHPRRHSHEDQEFRCRSSDRLPRRHSHEDQEFRCHSHVRDYRKYSEDGSLKEPLESKGRSHSKIEKFSESFEQQLCFRTKRSASLGPESRKERNERECLRMEIKSRKKVEEERSSRKEEHGEAHMAPLFEKGPE
ncbi:leukemia NUP98 fusion partner 1 isoform X2 [Hylobates moloch]|nr:leukemia NUP98 fusion partner 1 isoform X2 [Hylobates moloch]